MSDVLKQVTIVIATYNSMHVLPRVADAIDAQTFPREMIDVLLVDGGSTDETIKFGRSKGYTVIDNPRTEPVYAKYLGFHKAKTKYLIYLDHDEVFENERCIEDQVSCATRLGMRVVLSSGYVNPPGEHAINEYINEYGDPFSFFIYRLSKSPKYFIKEMASKYDIEEENSDCCIVNFGEEGPLPLIELLAMGTLIDRSYFNSVFSDYVKNAENLPHLFYFLMSKDTRVGICKKHMLVHYSSESIQGYLKKISWRIYNNIYHRDGVGAAGYLVRDKLMAKRAKSIDKIKKYLFIPYALLIVPSIVDTLYLICSRRKLVYVLHTPLSIYAASKIVFNQVLFLFGYKPRLKSYDGTKVIDDD
ncbi:glycosyltransferase [Vibrio sp. JC009]|uniref:glycosyltransferase family 2 protein n=1 Tax=Vibrio sp. JC009 TaxID=2912314 RepID=UPI0023B03609|nr:glycosyltransferase family 2 protein [Vibrio sp. JC009]WED22003.1 glycosyltransferase [Vibrio sp. JC009]